MKLASKLDNITPEAKFYCPSFSQGLNQFTQSMVNISHFDTLQRERLAYYYITFSW